MGASNLCSACNLDNCDLQLQGCGCFLHVTCCPLSLILDGKKPLGANLPVGPVKSLSTICGLCGSGPVSGIRMLPLSFQPLEKSVKLRLAVTPHSSLYPKSAEEPQVSGQKKRTREDDEVSEREAETVQVVYSMGKKHALATNLSDSETQRTGRWGDEEVAFVDYLVNSFNHGQLPIPHGTKLSAFLGDLLMCKPSRLTKKMKNAKLSARSFYLVAPDTSRTMNFRLDGNVVNKLQRSFIQSLATDYSQLEIGFLLSKHWRSFFSDLCQQVGYPFLDASMYLLSLEEYERRSALAEERMRNVRRKTRMGISNKSDEYPRATTPSLGVPVVEPPNTPTVSAAPEPTLVQLGPALDKVNDNVFGGLGVPVREETHDEGSASLDYLLDSSLADFIDLSEPPTEVESKYLLGGKVLNRPVRQHQDPFLEAIVTYLEQHNLPFQHADAWVPSFVDGSDDEVQLFHVGSVTRRDIKDDKVWSALESFGEYSKGFTFTPGVDLVGHVYSSGNISWWERGVKALDPNFFLRASGAKKYGVQIAAGIPFSTPGVGRMVVILYGSNHTRQADDAMVHQCAEEFSRYSPEPKWKLVIDIEDQPESSSPPVVGEVATSSHGRTTSPVNDQSTSTLPTSSITPSFDPSGYVVINEIVSLFGEQLALDNGCPLSRSDKSSATNVDSSPFFHEFVSIRLMLLRPEHRRSSEENEAIEILKCSYKAHCSAGNVQSGTKLATQLAREWLLLIGSSQSPSASTSWSVHHNNPKEDHAVHVMMKPSIMKPLSSYHNATMESEAMQLLPSKQTKLGPTIRSTPKSFESSAGVQTIETSPKCVGSMRRTVSSGTIDHLSSVGGTSTDSPEA